MENVTDPPISERSRRWAATMEGYEGAADDVTVAHRDSWASLDVSESASKTPGTSRNVKNSSTPRSPPARPGATERGTEPAKRNRRIPDLLRARPRRVLHSSAFRRLAGKTQVFVFPDDHMRTRLTHALEVAQVATGVARAVGLNVALTEAIALGHDCGHGPGGHASEEALDPFVFGASTTRLGADVSLVSLNLCRETLDGIRNHSWSRPAQ